MPAGCRGLLVADSARARAWERGLARAGFAPVRVETEGADSDKGAWQVGVPAAQEAAARTYVSDVIAGRARLPGEGRAGLVVTLAVALAVIAAVVLAWLR